MTTVYLYMNGEMNWFVASSFEDVATLKTKSCHEKHVDEYIHWLEGGEVEGLFDGEWYPYDGNNPDVLFNDPSLTFRIKPHVSTKYALYDKELNVIVSEVFNSKEDLLELTGQNHIIAEIKVVL